MEGILTCLVALMGYIFLVSFPDDSSGKSRAFLTPEERRFIVARINADRGDAEVEKFNLGKFLSAGLDVKIWGFALIFGCVTTVTYR